MDIDPDIPFVGPNANFVRLLGVRAFRNWVSSHPDHYIPPGHEHTVPDDQPLPTWSNANYSVALGHPVDKPSAWWQKYHGHGNKNKRPHKHISQPTINAIKTLAKTTVARTMPSKRPRMTYYQAKMALQPSFKVRRLNRRTGGFMGFERPGEKKFNDKEKTNTALTASWALYDPSDASLTGVAQGVGTSQRIGRYYDIHSITVHGMCILLAKIDQAQPPPDVLVKICVVLDKQTNGAQLSATDVWQTDLTEDILAFRNLEHQGRFTVLKTWNVRMVAQVTGEGDSALSNHAHTEKKFMWYKKFKRPIRVQTCATGAGIAAMTTNSIHVIAIATHASNASIDYISRIRYSG